MYQPHRVRFYLLAILAYLVWTAYLCLADSYVDLWVFAPLRWLANAFGPGAVLFLGPPMLAALEHYLAFLGLSAALFVCLFFAVIRTLGRAPLFLLAAILTWVAGSLLVALIR